MLITDSTSSEDDFSGFSTPKSAYFTGNSSVFAGYVRLWEHGAYVFGKIRRHNRWWLVKSVNPQARDADFRRRNLRQEFDLAVSLDHEGVVRVIDFADIPEVGQGIVMEYIGGDTLQQALKKGISPAQVSLLWNKLLDAVGYLHSRGLVHGDIKPSNIMVTPDGRGIRLIDFGLGNAQWCLWPQGSGGTSGYSAPEQLAGQPADMRADVFALGSTLQKLRPQMPLSKRLSLKPVQRRAMRLEPEKRYESAQTMAAACRQSARRMVWLPVLLTAVLIGVVVLCWLTFPEETNPVTNQSPTTQSQTNPETGLDDPDLLDEDLSWEDETWDEEELDDTELMESDSDLIELQEMTKSLDDLYKTYSQAVDMLIKNGWSESKYWNLRNQFSTEVRHRQHDGTLTGAKNRDIDSLLAAKTLMREGLIPLMKVLGKTPDTSGMDPEMQQAVKIEEQWMKLFDYLKYYSSPSSTLVDR